MSLFSLFLATPRHMEFLDQGSYLSHSCDLYHSCSHARSLTHSARPRIEHASQFSRDTIDPFAPQRELWNVILHIHSLSLGGGWVLHLLEASQPQSMWIQLFGTWSGFLSPGAYPSCPQSPQSCLFFGGGLLRPHPWHMKVPRLGVE